jgi:probable F420-dependent oxidoreductase
MWGAGYGPKALTLIGQKCDGFILQLADPYLVEWTSKFVKNAATEAGRNPDDITICVAAPAYVGDDIDHQRDQVRWFGGMVGNHVADLVERYGDDGSMVPAALSDYIKTREGYDYDHHGKAGNPSTDFVPDEVIDRFCILGTVDQHIARMEELRDIGVDQFSIYLMHDQQEKTLDAYGETVIPALRS